MRKYIIYRHTSPSGKVYIGQTCVSTAIRWGKDGSGYLRSKDGRYNQPAFAKAIEKYGWDNFKHEVLFHGCSKELADKLEMAFIKYYKDLGMSYNVALGGEGNVRHTTEEERIAARKSNHHRQYLKHKDEYSTQRNKYYQEHKDEYREYGRNYRQSHKEELREYMREYHKANKDKIIARVSQYNAEHKEERRKYKQEYYYAHRDELIAKKRKYNAEHKEERREYYQRKKALTQKTTI